MYSAFKIYDNASLPKPTTCPFKVGQIVKYINPWNGHSYEATYKVVSILANHSVAIKYQARAGYFASTSIENVALLTIS